MTKSSDFNEMLPESDVELQIPYHKMVTKFREN